MKVVIGKKNVIEITENSDLIIVVPFGKSSNKECKDYYDYAIQLQNLNPDMLQELTTIFPFRDIRKNIINDLEIPYGTVFAYEFIFNCLNQNAKSKKEVEFILKQTLNDQIESGIDYLTVHASLNSRFITRHANELNNRIIGIASRAGSMLLSLMKSLKIDNPIYEHFDYIAKLSKETNTAISLGSTFRAGAISDCMDNVHLSEIYEQKNIFEICLSYGVSNVLLEGFGHGIPQDFKHYSEIIKKELPSIPITALGPLPVDSAVGLDDVAASIGIAMGRLNGLALVNILTSKEHITLPNIEDCKRALSYAKLGGYIGDVMKTGKNSIKDKKLSIARKNLDWKKQIEYTILPKIAESLLNKNSNGYSCSICEGSCPHLNNENFQI